MKTNKKYSQLFFYVFFPYNYFKRIKKCLSSLKYFKITYTVNQMNCEFEIRFLTKIFRKVIKHL